MTALCLFVGAGAAFAATQANNYKGTTFSFSGGAGSAKKPAPVGFKETLKAHKQRLHEGRRGPDRHQREDLRSEVERQVLPHLHRHQRW